MATSKKTKKVTEAQKDTLVKASKVFASHVACIGEVGNCDLVNSLYLTPAEAKKFLRAVKAIA